MKQKLVLLVKFCQQKTTLRIQNWFILYMLQSVTDFKSIREQSLESDIWCYFVTMNTVNVNVYSAKTVCVFLCETSISLENKLGNSLKKVDISEISRTKVQKMGKGLFTIQTAILIIQKCNSWEGQGPEGLFLMSEIPFVLWILRRKEWNNSYLKSIWDTQK